jgi:hypothetical protein
VGREACDGICAESNRIGRFPECKDR